MFFLPSFYQHPLDFTRTNMSTPFKIPRSKYSFEALQGYFVYTNPNIPNESLPAYAPKFGLEDGKTWKEVLEDLRRLNSQANHTRKSYKLIFAARHGEGVHNVAEQKYGTKEWDAKWSLLKGDGKGAVWGPDPPLTKVGEGQAKDANEKWQKELKNLQDPVPIPTLFFSSPMIRSARTLQLTYDGIVWPATNGQDNKSAISPIQTRPHILECLREDFKDRHTCDERSKRSTISASWEPFNWTIDATMDEEDTIFAVSNNNNGFNTSSNSLFLTNTNHLLV